MKLTQKFFILFTLYFAAVGFAFSQDKSPNEKNEKTKQKPINVTANVLILDAEDEFADDIKAENLRIFEDGAEQKITYFAKKPTILNLGILIDNSGSMRPELEEIISIGKSIVSNLHENEESFILRFVSSDKIEVTEDWTSDKTKLKTALDNLYIEGGASAITDAIYLASEKILEREKKDKSKKYALVVISDGEDRDSYYKYEQLLSLLKKSNIEVFMISYAFQAPLRPKAAAKFADKLIFETGGEVINLTKKRTKEDLIAALKTLLIELRSQYVIGYTSTNQKRDGLPRKLTVQVADSAKGEKRQGFIRESFVVPQD